MKVADGCKDVSSVEIKKVIAGQQQFKKVMNWLEKLRGSKQVRAGERCD